VYCLKYDVKPEIYKHHIPKFFVHISKYLQRQKQPLWVGGREDPLSRTNSLESKSYIPTSAST